MSLLLKRKKNRPTFEQLEEIDRLGNLKSRCRRESDVNLNLALDTIEIAVSTTITENDRFDLYQTIVVGKDYSKPALMN